MKNIRSIIREEITKVTITSNSEQILSTKNEELNSLLSQIEFYSASGKSPDYNLSKINTIILAWTKMNDF